MRIKIIKKANTETKPLTIKQQKVVSLVSGNVGKMGSKAEILRQAGYSPSVVNNPDHVFNSPAVKEKIDPVIKQMLNIRNKVLDALEEKSFKKESAYNLCIMASTMTKNIEMLEGRPASREEFQLPEEEKKRLTRLLELNSKCSNCGH